MNVCARYDCGWMGAGCIAQNCPRTPFIYPIAPNPSPRTMPVNIPFSTFGVTIVIMNGNGEITIKVEQPHPALTPAERSGGSNGL